MAKSKTKVIAQLLEIAKTFDDAGETNKGQDIRDLIQDINSNKRDHAAIKIQARVQIDKYDGEKLPNSVPVEVQEFISEL